MDILSHSQYRGTSPYNMVDYSRYYIWSDNDNKASVVAQSPLTALTHWPLGDLNVIFKLISVIVGWGISCEIAFRWMSLDLTDGKSTLIQVMAWCRQATSHYLSQCWPRSMSLYGATRPQWVITSDKNHPIRWVLWVHDSSWHILLNKQPNIWPRSQKSNNFFILTT